MATLVQSHPAEMPASVASSHPFTCNTCQVAFRSGDLQRTHMQSDWHRYNLKRRVASLPPLTSEIFAEKVLANKATAAATAARASFEKSCEACDKTYYSEGAYLNHLGSQKHKILETKLLARKRGLEGMETDSMADSTFTLGETLDTASTQRDEDSDSEEELQEGVDDMRSTGLSAPSDPARRPQVPTPSTAAKHDEQTVEDDNEEEYDHKANLEQCLFCNYISPSLDLNVNHMSKQHSFFIPERDYLVDLAGLVNYLSETVTVLHQCLYCHKSVHTSAGVQTHMRDRGHCMIAYSTEDEQMEIGDFYDFRSTYSDADSEDEDDEKGASGGVSLGAKRRTKTTAQNEAGEDIEMEGNEDGWESDDASLSSVPTDEITSVPIEQDHNYAKLELHRHHSHNDPRPHKNSDGFHSHAHHSSAHAVYHDDFELHLPSGRTAGHRSLRAYFRQNLRNYPSAEERSRQRMIEDGRRESDADDSDADDTSTEAGDASRGRQVMSRANGGLGMVGVSEAKKREVKAVEKRDRKREQRAQARYQWGNDKQNNFQKHFRDPLLQ